MSDGVVPARPRGPWDPPDGALSVKSSVPASAPLEEAPRQPLGWAILSTLLLAGFITYLMGWKWALAGVIGVFVHEYGHVMAINALGCGPGRIHIVPFLGGAAHMARSPSTEFKGVLISLAGPTFGLVAAAPFFLAAYFTGDDSWAGAAFFIAVINLINLLPAPPLDGSKALGPALARIHPLFERAALLLVGVGAVWWAISNGSYLFAAFVGFGVFTALAARRLRPPALQLDARQWFASLGLYLLAVAACVAVMLLAMNGIGEPGRIMRMLKGDFSAA